MAPINRDCAPAPWEAGYRSFAFLSGGRIALTVQHGLSHGMAVAGPDGTTRTVAVPLTSIKPYLAAVPGGLAVIGSAAARCFRHRPDIRHRKGGIARAFRSGP